MDTPDTSQSEQVQERDSHPPEGQAESSKTQADLQQRSSENPAVPKSKKSKSKGTTAKREAKKAKEVAASDTESDETDSSDSDDDTVEESEEDSETDTETEKEKKKKRKAKKKAKQKAKEKRKAKSKRKARKEVSSDSDTDSDSNSASDAASSSGVDEDDDEDEYDQNAELKELLQQQLQQLQLQGGPPRRFRPPPPMSAPRGSLGRRRGTLRVESHGRKKSHKDKKSKKDKTKKKRGTKLEFKRVDQLWDNSTHDYRLSDTVEGEESSEYDQCLFTVRRCFDWEGKYKNTVVDIRSKLLKDALDEAMVGVKGISLVEETPAVDPNLLFVYLEDIRTLCQKLKTRKVTVKKGKKKAKKRNETTRKHLKILLKYLDEDYASIKKSLYPMLESGLITFDLIWALYKPDTIAYTTTYGAHDEPRAFKIELAEKESSFMRGEWYSIEGKYMEYDGKVWGMGDMSCEVASFKGAKKISSLTCYPLKYHKNEAKIRAELIERGKKFVALQGVNYKSHEGLAFHKKRKQIVKVNINGRIMIDPAIHRRLLPNYPISTVKPKDADSHDGDSDDEFCNDSDSQYSSDEGSHRLEQIAEKAVKTGENGKGESHDATASAVTDGPDIPADDVPTETTKDDVPQEEKEELPVFTDEEYLIASPVVLGFAFTEKLWLEFTVSGVKDIVWNEGAYESLVLEENTKEIVKALVVSHKYHPSESIDDIIQGKGKGLVTLLHGPPGTGKTLMAEGIAELLKCPLYMVTAGELGTDPRTLEVELQKILDIAHAWGAVLLLDEADVFLETRKIQDIHRNALVSIFLRLLEYFQGILFLTTNRVETFDDAFQSRIHIALRYSELSVKAKKTVFKLFIERVRALEGVDTMPFTEEDLDALSRHNLNGRQIKNTVRTAKALAVNKGERLGMVHIKRVLDIATAFDRDLKGGTGFEDAMRSYF